MLIDILGSRYIALYVFSIILRILGVINAGIAVLDFFKTAATPVIIPLTGQTPEQLTQISIDLTTTAFGILLGRLLFSMALYALGEFIKLAIDVEENSRELIRVIRYRSSGNRQPAKTNDPSGIQAPNYDDDPNIWKPKR